MMPSHQVNVWSTLFVMLFISGCGLTGRPSSHGVSCHNNLRTYRDCLENYKKVRGVYPQTLQVIDSTNNLNYSCPLSGGISYGLGYSPSSNLSTYRLYCPVEADEFNRNRLKVMIEITPQGTFHRFNP
jgi:hypothetical protein